jgi:hypothetical protein
VGNAFFARYINFAEQAADLTRDRGALFSLPIENRYAHVVSGEGSRGRFPQTGCGTGYNGGDLRPQFHDKSLRANTSGLL